MAFPNHVRVDQHFIRARLRTDGTTVEINLAQAPVSETPAAGWTVDVVDVGAAEITDAEIDVDAKQVLLTIAPTAGDKTLRLSYDPDAGTIMGDDFALIAFTDRAVANFSEQQSGPTPPEDYPLDDDGSLASVFGFGYMPTNEPDRLRADYTYADSSTGGTVLALPSSARAFNDQAIVVDAGKVLKFEAVIHGVSAAAFDNIGLAAALSSAGTPTGVAIVNRISDETGSDPEWGGTGISDQIRSAATAGFRLGLEIDGDAGQITMKSSDGDIVSAATFTPGTAFTFYLFAVDNGTPTNVGETLSIEAIPAAADMALSYSPSAVDVFGNT